MGGAIQKHFVEFDDDLLRTAKQGDSIVVVLSFNVQEGYHIQDVTNTKDNLITTEIKLQQHSDYTILNQEFTTTNYESVTLNQFTHRVLSNILEVTVTLKLENKSIDPDLNLKGHLMYQACDDKQCYFPRTLNFSVKL